MKKIVLLVSLVFSLGLYAEALTQESKTPTVVADISENGKHVIKRQIYAEDGTLKSYTIARTNLAKGTYMQYYKNGTLKQFTIVN